MLINEELLIKLRQFIDEYLKPVEIQLVEYYHNADGKWPERGDKWIINPILDNLIQEAKNHHLWNLWLPKSLHIELLEKHPNWDWNSILPHYEALTNLDYAYIAIETGKYLFCAEILNCNAPGTGNMEIIGKFGTNEQHEKWLLPMLLGDMKSCFAMTEYEVSSSDPTQLVATAIKTKKSINSMNDFCLFYDKEMVTRTEKGTGIGMEMGMGMNKRGESDTWVLSGRKWWTTGACDPRCQCCIFVALTDTRDHPTPTNTNNSVISNNSRQQQTLKLAVHERHTLFILSMDSPGVEVVRPLTVFGYDDAPHGHAEVVFTNVIVNERDSLLGSVGKGFELAQSRLGR